MYLQYSERPIYLQYSVRPMYIQNYVCCVACKSIHVLIKVCGTCELCKTSYPTFVLDEHSLAFFFCFSEKNTHKHTKSHTHNNTQNTHTHTRARTHVHTHTHTHTYMRLVSNADMSANHPKCGLPKNAYTTALSAI